MRVSHIYVLYNNVDMCYSGGFCQLKGVHLSYNTVHSMRKKLQLIVSISSFHTITFKVRRVENK